MIAKMVKGRGFRGALEYDLTKEKGRVIDSNMAGQNPRALAAEFGEIRRLRPNLGKAVLHVSLSAAPGEKLSDTQWREIGKRYMEGMGLDRNQFVITRHTDTEHEHIHVLANRIRFDGSVTSDSQDYKRQEAIMRVLERYYGLQRVAPSQEAERKAPTQGEIETQARTGQPSTRQQLQQLCDAATKDCKSFTEYQERLEAAGVELVPVVQLEGAKLSGLSYRLDGVMMKGSDLGKGYAAAGIQKRGISYEQDRDFAAVRRSLERETIRTFGEPDRDGAEGQLPERRGVGVDVGAISAVDGRVSGRDAADARSDQSPESGNRRDVQPSSEHGDAELAGSRRGRPEGRQLPGSSREPDGVESLRSGLDDGDRYDDFRERIVALGSPSRDREPVRSASRGAVSEARRDRSLEAIQKQITALGVPRFEVGLREAKTGQMMNREWSRAEFEQSVAWLKRMNARGNDVYIRPAGNHGLVLVDDVNRSAIERMKADGFEPAATIETSPGNYQAWVKLSDYPLAEDIRKMAARELATHYEGDLNSADGRHYGRLAGFTNQKPKHTHNGKQPYVLAHECHGKAANRAIKLTDRIEMDLDTYFVKNERKGRLNAISESGSKQGRYDPIDEYHRQAKKLMATYGDAIDLSRMDWMIAVDMAKSGRFRLEDIEKSIRECSPNVESRKAGHMENYARRTADNAWNSPEVELHREARKLERSLDRGMSR